jgi:hypothetical protein
VNRREFLECAAILVSGVTASRVGFALSDDQLTYLAAAPDYASKPVNYFTPEQRHIVAAMAEIIIPRTDTPGAIDAGVPKFIELMVADWFNDQERELFSAGLGDMEARFPQEFGMPFHRLDAAQQLAILEAMEAAAAASPWYAQGNVRRDFISDAPFICMVKELTIWGFFTSEKGASQVLRYSAMPMRFDGHAALSPNDSSWAPYMFL